MSLLDKITAQLPIGRKTEDTEYFFALNINLSEVTAVVWGIFNNEVDILGQSTLVYQDTDDLLDKAYRALDSSLGALEIEPQKILFGVPDAWSLDDNLKEPYLKLLRKMLKEYDLQALAYVTTTNALSYFLQKQEGSPPSTILLGIGDFIEVTLVRGGKIIGTRVTKRTEQLFSDIEGVLRQFTEVEVLPSKIQIYSTKENDDLGRTRDELMSYPWMQRLSFLHFPRIEVLEDSIATEAIILSAASEINPQVSLKRSFITSRQKSLRDLEGLYPPTKGQRQLSRTKPLPSKETHQTRESHTQNDEDSGFVRGDIRERVHTHSTGQEVVTQEEEGFALQEAEDLEDDNLISPDLPDKKHGQRTTSFLGIITSLMGSVIPSISRIKLTRLVGSKLIIAPLVLLLLALAYLFLVKVTITVLVEPKILENNAEIVADPKVSQVDEGGKIIPGTVVETTVSGSDKTTATGTKQIGDPARGKVIIYNMTSSPVSLSQGTTLTSDNSLKFTLDSSAQIASQSSSLGADLTTVITPGKTNPVGVTAVTIGPDSNLPASSDASRGLSIGGYSKSHVIALITEALSGGTSKNVTVVTSDDQKKLQAKVVDDLRQKAQEDLQGKSSPGRKIISEALAVADGKYNFNKAVNDQANEFSLSATVHFKGTAYSDADLKTIVAKLVETNIPEGFAMNPQDTETQADVAKVEKNGRLIFNAKFKAKLLPKLDLGHLREQVRGRSVAETVSKLRELENVVGAEVKFSPNLPGSLARIPLLDKNISINVTPK